MEQARLPASSVVATVAMIGALGFAMLACGSSTAKSGGHAGCQVGQPIEAVKGDALPACTKLETASSSYRYPCTDGPSTQSAAGFFIIYLPSQQLYGKPGGVWHRAAANVSFAEINRRLGC